VGESCERHLQGQLPDVSHQDRQDGRTIRTLEISQTYLGRDLHRISERNVSRRGAQLMVNTYLFTLYKLIFYV